MGMFNVLIRMAIWMTTRFIMQKEPKKLVFFFGFFALPIVLRTTYNAHFFFGIILIFIQKGLEWTRSCGNALLVKAH